MFAGVVALLVGVVGLLAPVSASPPQEPNVSCGSAVAPDFSEARAHDDGSAANVPVLDELIVDTNYTELCDMAINDRRAWTIPVAAIGALVLAAAVALTVRDRRKQRS